MDRRSTHFGCPRIAARFTPAVCVDEAHVVNLVPYSGLNEPIVNVSVGVESAQHFAHSDGEFWPDSASLFVDEVCLQRRG